jgi:hypothetical protein
MDKESDRIREHLASQADLLAAVRLPNTTFKDNAGTVVTTDIIFLQKRGAGQAPGGAPWRQVLDYRSSPEQVFSFSLNEYYVRNPDMMLGSMTRATPDREVTAYLRGFAAYTFHHNLENPLGTIMSIERTLRGFEAIQGRLESDIARDQKELAEYRVESEKPFEYEEQLKQLLVKQAQLNAELDLGKDDKQAVTAESEGGAAKAVEGLVAVVDGLMGGGQKSTKQQAHDKAQPAGNVETREQSIASEELQADKSEIIKEYDRIVDGRPEARKQLEQTNPGLVAARDKAITELRREKITQELAQKQELQQRRAARR